MSPSNACFRAPTSRRGHRASTVVLFHSGLSRVVETTNFGIAFILSPNSPVPSIFGHAGEALVGHAPQQLRVGVHQLLELELVARVAAVELNAQPRCSKPLRPSRRLEHAVERDELRHNELAHLPLLFFAVVGE